MSLISPVLWHTYMGGLPMPEGCTYYQFAVAREALWAQERLDAAVILLDRLNQLRKRPGLSPLAQELVDNLISTEVEQIEL